MAIIKSSKYNLGQAVRHRVHDFGGIIVDIDAVFGGTEEWFQAIPVSLRPKRDQPFYRVRVEQDGQEAMAYVSEQNLLADAAGKFTPIAAQLDAREATADTLGLLH